MEVGSIMYPDYIGRSQHMSHHSPPLSVKTRNLIIPERKEDKSEDTSVQSVPLSIETGIVINSDSLEKIHYVNERQCNDSQP